MLYLESGVLPARFAIKRMKLVFLRYILTQEENSLIKTFLMAQKIDPKKGDWYSEVRDILKEYDIQMSDEEIKKMPENIFKSFVKKQTYSVSLYYLQSKQRKGEKAHNIIYESMKLQDYLNSCSNLKLEEQRNIFSLRSRMNELKTNF